MMQHGHRFPPGTAQRDADDVTRIVAGIARMTDGDHRRAVRLLSLATGCLVADWGREKGHTRIHRDAQDATGQAQRVIETWKTAMATAMEEADTAHREALLFQIGAHHHNREDAA